MQHAWRNFLELCWVEKANLKCHLLYDPMYNIPSISLGGLGGLFQDLSHKPQSKATQILYTKWHRTVSYLHPVVFHPRIQLVTEFQSTVGWIHEFKTQRYNQQYIKLLKWQNYRNGGHISGCQEPVNEQEDVTTKGQDEEVLLWERNPAFWLWWWLYESMLLLFSH